jgi:hypothetical protein
MATSVFNVSAIGFKNLNELSLTNIKDDIKNNRIVLKSNCNTESYDLILPNNAPNLNKNYLVSDDNGNLTWSAPLSTEVLPTEPSGPPLIFNNDEYIFSPIISKMVSIKGKNNSSINFNENDDTITINSNNSFLYLFSNIISLGFNGNPSIDITEDYIIIKKPLIIGNYKLEVINDELLITKFDNTTQKYIPGVVVI